MFCTACGREIGDAEFCPFCGAEACLPDAQPEEDLGKNWKAILSLLSGVGAWLLLFHSNLIFSIYFELDFLNCLLALLLLAGIIFGILAYKDPRVKKRDFATIGLTCSILAIVLLFHSFIF